jgi:hypothetical protein
MPGREKRMFVKLDEDEHRRFVSGTRPLWKRRGFTSFSNMVRELLYKEERRKK